MHKYFPHTEENIEEMLEKIGVKKIEDLFLDIPKASLINGELNLPSGLSEGELRKNFLSLAKKNKELKIYLGSGSYDVYVPSAISSILSREEFLTAYTPYQAEISQGTLQYIFEFQSVVCELTKMDISNASMYDGATATSEAMYMAAAETKKSKILISKTINPRTIEVLKTYAHFKGLKIEYIKNDENKTCLFDLQNKIDEETAAVIIQNPNYYGSLEDVKDISNITHNSKALLIQNGDLRNYSVLASPYECGADIACGEAQTMGMDLSFGGPYLGYIATTKKLMRKLPGRIVGMTTDTLGQRGYVLTLQAREQHIRREKATSNICSNQSLMALNCAIYASLMGKEGLKEVSKISYSLAHYLYQKLLETKLFEKVYDNPFFNEFTVRYLGDSKKLNEYLLSQGYLGGMLLDNNKIIFAVTETKTEKEIDEFVQVIKCMIN